MLSCPITIRGIKVYRPFMLSERFARFMLRFGIMTGRNAPEWAYRVQTSYFHMYRGGL